MKRILSIACICLLPISAFTQASDMYEDLTRPSINRKLTVYGGHLQLDAAYFFETGNSSFESDGKKVGVKDASATALSNSLVLGLKYGITDWLEFTADMAYSNNIASEATVVLIDFATLNYFDQLEQAKGMGDLYTGLTIRLPFNISWFDFAAHIGTSLPTSATDPDQPGHSYDTWDPASGSYQVFYKYYPKNGKGVSHPMFGASLNMNSGKIGFWTDYYFRPVSNEFETFKWEHRLNGSTFTYRQEAYNMKHPSESYFNFTIGYQAFPWFIAYAAYYYRGSTGGWTESPGQRIAFPESSLSSFSLNFEIQVSTHLRFNQYFNFPLAGKNTWSSFSFLTGFSYTLVPLQNLYY